MTVCRAFVLAVSGALSKRRWISWRAGIKQELHQWQGPSTDTITKASLSNTQHHSVLLSDAASSHILSLLVLQKGLPRAHSTESQPRLKRHSTNCTLDYPLPENTLEMTAGFTAKLHHLPAELTWAPGSVSWKRHIMHCTRGLLKTPTLVSVSIVLRFSCCPLSFFSIFYPRVETFNYTEV